MMNKTTDLSPFDDEEAQSTSSTSPEMHRVGVGSLDNARGPSPWWKKLLDQPQLDSDEEEYTAVSATYATSPYSGMKWWSVHYFIDWVLVVGLVLVELCLSHYVLKPYDRYLPINDPSVTYPLLDDIVPAWTLGFIDGLGPVSIFLAMQLIFRSAHDFHNACLGLAQALVFTLIFTDSIKFAAGRYRPDWLARVNSNASESVLTDGRESFPSGHSSISFAAQVFLSLYLAGKLGLYRRYGGAAWKAIICLFPIAVATTVAVSRVRDYHHNFDDILAGSLLGAGIGIMTYFMNYHSVASENSHLPKLRVDRRVVYTHPVPVDRF